MCPFVRRVLLIALGISGIVVRELTPDSTLLCPTTEIFKIWIVVDVILNFCAALPLPSLPQSDDAKLFHKNPLFSWEVQIFVYTLHLGWASSGAVLLTWNLSCVPSYFVYFTLLSVIVVMILEIRMAIGLWLLTDSLSEYYFLWKLNDPQMATTMLVWAQYSFSSCQTLTSLSEINAIASPTVLPHPPPNQSPTPQPNLGYHELRDF
eukprot:c18877_g1_i1.p1 GENE.c18877_g1_i1~~c18877_g1_i1.p1  ORF type:complete len:207 (-),score=29.78 c18877_g1_i1:18-638(-)